MATPKQDKLAEFVNWAKQHVTGDEKGEAQVFLDRLFQAFGHGGVKEAGATLEFRVKKEAAGGTAFADLVFKPVVLIEMKRRGEKLERHFRQAFDYWLRLTPGRPRYVILCNFDEFWIYDFDAQFEFPVDRVNLSDLPERYGPLAFLFAQPETPIFGNDHEAVTREAADHLANCFNSLVHREIPRESAQRFVLQILVALFSEDIGLLEPYLVARLLEDCTSPQASYDLIGGLFRAMNSRQPESGGRFKGVDYFNGGLFAEPSPLELQSGEVHLLREAAKADWSKVRPEIFGTLFEHSMEAEERHAFGAHFTSPVDILKVVKPTIVDPWSGAIESARTQTELNTLLTRMQRYRVLDPACGSGNFLYIAYRELKRLEARIFERLSELSGSKKRQAQTQIGFVTAQNFYGMDINPFAVELAKVTMMIARKLAIDELRVQEKALPLDNLDANFVADDALVQGGAFVRNWPDADVIIGNPPFLGAKRLKPERGADYVSIVRSLYPAVPGMADYCVYWFRKAHDHLKPCTEDDPFCGRAGLVGTQNIRSNKSRVGGLDHIVRDGTIVEAIDNQPWSGEANVNVSIVNWIKSQNSQILPKRRVLWGKSPQKTSRHPNRSSLKGLSSSDYELEFQEIPHINSALSGAVDLSEAVALRCNQEKCFTCQGITPGHSSFVLSHNSAHALVQRDERSIPIVRPYLIGRELLTGDGTPSQCLIDFGNSGIVEARAFGAAFSHLEKNLLPDLEAKAKKAHVSDKSRTDQLARWWKHWRSRQDLIQRIEKLGRYVVCSRVTKRPVFVFVSSSIRPGDALQAFCFDDDYSFGVLQSHVHWQWFIANCSKLTERYRYTAESVFDTFPWPQYPQKRQIEAVATAGKALRDVRNAALKQIDGGLRELYRLLELPGENSLRDAHAALDEATLKAYGFSAKKDILAQLLELNQDVAQKLDKAQLVSGPGIPTDYPTPENLISHDCVEPDPLV